MLTTLHGEDDVLRINSPLGKAADDMNGFYNSAQSMMYNPAVQSVFTYSAADSARYGSSSFGNATPDCQAGVESLEHGFAFRSDVVRRRMGHAHVDDLWTRPAEA